VPGEKKPKKKTNETPAKNGEPQTEFVLEHHKPLLRGERKHNWTPYWEDGHERKKKKDLGGVRHASIKKRRESARGDYHISGSDNIRQLCREERNWRLGLRAIRAQLSDDNVAISIVKKKSRDRVQLKEKEKKDMNKAWEKNIGGSQPQLHRFPSVDPTNEGERLRQGKKTIRKSL